MKLDDIFETAVSTRKVVWSKRGDKITRHEVDTKTGLKPLKQIRVKSNDS